MTTIHYKLSDEQLAAKRSGRPVASAASGSPLESEKPIQAVPADKWPQWVKWLQKRRRSIDIGPGDTINWKLGKFGKKYKKILQAVGVPCGCNDRQAEFNAKYPYP